MPEIVQTKQDLVAIVSAHSKEIKDLGVARLGLFGSFGRGTPDADSDVDVLVDFEPGQKTFDHFMTLAFLLEDLFQRRVELITREGLSPYIGPRILAETEDVPIGP
ncbi:MAG: nucleotidyltransferase family protein [Candidatus Hydrogenedentes bacterium]|nr:nucleotidyltransferase family protein [Candidatus Hydrogenedentota bacterium]